MIQLSAIRQAGALPYRKEGDALSVLLITSTGTKRWIVPKGHVEPGLSIREAAEFEAYEEAGVIGHLAPRSVGSYSYRKRPERGGDTYRVRVYPLQVTQEFDDYPEAELRERRWLSVPEAIEIIGDSELRRLVEKFPTKLA